MDSRFILDPNLASASTPPADWYTDPAMLALEREKVFRRTWQYAASLDLLQFPGNYAAGEVNKTPVVLVRGQDEEIRAFYNVCRHRAGVVAHGCGNRKSLQCQYHGWLYGLDGKLINAPEFDGVENFYKEDFGLIPVRVETWGPFAFVNMDSSAPPLVDVLGKIPEETRHLDFSSLRKFERCEYVVHANWKVYIDNYLEGYHIPIAHPGLFKEVDYDKYRVDTFRYYSSQYAPIRPVRSEDPAGRVFTELKGDEQAFYYWIFPNFMVNAYPGNVQINIVQPLSHDKTKVIFEWYFADPGTPEAWNNLQDGIAFSDNVQKEDMVLCEDVQRNLESGVYRQGRYSVKRENGVHHFHSLMQEFLNK
ncbi:MAG TPA: SRPBCC family protein [Anaerolineales bacterium]|nr:SRPBCC family protein [Anaerolineales bacterium]